MGHGRYVFLTERDSVPCSKRIQNGTSGPVRKQKDGAGRDGTMIPSSPAFFFFSHDSPPMKMIVSFRSLIHYPSIDSYINPSRRFFSLCQTKTVSGSSSSGGADSNPSGASSSESPYEQRTQEGWHRSGTLGVVSVYIDPPFRTNTSTVGGPL